MNEPACGGLYERSMSKANLHFFGDYYGKYEHREVHNLYGYYNTQGTYEGLLERTGGQERPFVLTRSFYAGIQKYSAVWSGDCRAEWAHFNLCVPILL